MNKRTYRLNGQLQVVYKGLFTALLVFFAIEFMYEILREEYVESAIVGIWFTLSIYIFQRIIRTARIEFDDQNIYIKKGIFRLKLYVFGLAQITKIHTSFGGYFTSIIVYDDHKKKKLRFSCFNTIVSILKNNRTDVFRFNKAIVKNAEPESDTVELLRKRAQAAKESVFNIK